jgi:hypothetical protein
MRALVCATLLSVSLLGCGGDSNGPDEAFPDAAGVYNVTGSFDDLPSSVAHFEGTLTITQASRETGTLGGSAAYLATIGGDVFNLADDAINGAAISPTGVISFTLVDPSGSWTFTGTLSGTTIIDGRHTISDGSSSYSGAWSATTATAGIQRRTSAVSLSLSLKGLGERLAR